MTSSSPIYVSSSPETVADTGNTIMTSSSPIYVSSSPETIADTGNTSISSSEEYGTWQRLEPTENMFYCSKQQCHQRPQCREGSDSQSCDLTLILGDTKVKALRCVLVTCPYFMALYNSGMLESLTGEINVAYPDLHAMKKAIEFIYTKQLELTLKTVQRYVAVADYLQFTCMSNYCNEFLQNTELNMENCTQIMLMSSQYNLDVYAKAYQYVCGHLPQLMIGDQLLDLTETSVLSFLTDRTLSYVRPEDFFYFIVRWTERDELQRQQHYLKLFQALDLNRASARFLKGTVEKHPMVQLRPPCKLQCSQAYDVARSRGAPTEDNNFLMNDVIFVGGGQGEIDGEDTRFQLGQTVRAYLLAEKRWAYLPDMPRCIDKPQMTFTRGKLLVIDTDICGASDILCYCPLKNDWETFGIAYPDHNFGYQFHALTSCNDRVFIVASVYENQIHCTVHLFEVVWETNFSSSGSDSVSLECKFTCLSCSRSTIIQMTCVSLPTDSVRKVEQIYMTLTRNYETYRYNTLFLYNITDRVGWNLKINKFKIRRPLFLGLTEGLLNACPGESKATLICRGSNVMLRTTGYAIPHLPLADSDSYSRVDTADLLYSDDSADMLESDDSADMLDSDSPDMLDSDGGDTSKTSESNSEDVEADKYKAFMDIIEQDIYLQHLNNITEDAGDKPEDSDNELLKASHYDDTTFLCVDNKLYAFGGLMGQRSATCYSFLDHEWTVLENMPNGMVGAAAAGGTVPCDVLRCHALCPHCSFQQPSSEELHESMW